MGVVEGARNQIRKMEHIIDQINEAEDLLVSLKTPALHPVNNELMNDIEIGISTHFMGSGYFKEDAKYRCHRVYIEQDLGIKDIQGQIRDLIAESCKKRIEELKSELRKMIFYAGDRHE